MRHSLTVGTRIADRNWLNTWVLKPGIGSEGLSGMTFSLDWIGYVAALCSASGYVPQVLKIWKSGSCGDISLRTYLVLVTGFCLWMTYGIHKGDWPLILTNSVTLTCGAMILFFKLREHRSERNPATGDANGGAGEKVSFLSDHRR